VAALLEDGGDEVPIPHVLHHSPLASFGSRNTEASDSAPYAFSTPLHIPLFALALLAD
jgi:hypothetical protein